MSETVQRRKGLKRKQLTCSNRGCFSSKEEAWAFIEKLKNNRVRGSVTLIPHKCEKFHLGVKGDVYHAVQRRVVTKWQAIR